MKENKTQKKPSRFGIPFFLCFLILFAVWLLLSGHYDLFHISLGLGACFIVSYFSSDLLFVSTDYRRILIYAPRFLLYIPWLLFQIFLASINLIYIVFHPRMMDVIDPKVIRFRSRMRDHLALTVFANSITLTPGTITIHVSDFGDFSVHAIDKKSGDSLPGEMEERILKTFCF